MMNLIKALLTKANGGHIFIAVVAIACVAALAALGVLTTTVLTFISSVTFAIIGAGATKAVIKTAANLVAGLQNPPQTPPAAGVPSTPVRPPASGDQVRYLVSKTSPTLIVAKKES